VVHSKASPSRTAARVATSCKIAAATEEVIVRQPQGRSHAHYL
jgi:hypothetical protein